MSAAKKKTGLTPAKGAPIAVLVVVFGVVWIPQLVSLGGESGPDRVAAKRDRKAPSAPKRIPMPSTKKTQPEELDRRVKREPVVIDLASALEHDPFAPPAWSPEAARRAQLAEGTLGAPDEIEARVSELRNSGVAMVLVSEKGRAASINGQTIHVGDELDGFRVIEINATGIVVEPTARGADGDPGGGDDD